MTISESWEVIHSWIGQHHPAMLDLLRGPADLSELALLETQIGQHLPTDFKESWRIHNGSDPVSGLLIGLPLMSLKEIGQNWQGWAEIAEDVDTVKDLSEDCQSFPEGAVKLLYANRGWIPFAGDAMNFVALDFNPGPAGTSGQVINTGRDDEIRHVIAQTFTGFLAFVAEQFLAGKVSLNESSQTDPRWLSLAGGKRDFLTGFRYLLGLRQEP